MSKSKAQVIMPIDEYNNLVPKQPIKELMNQYSDMVSQLESLSKVYMKTDMVYIVAQEKLKVYNKVIWDLQTLDTRK
jgi:hypothetical protein